MSIECVCFWLRHLRLWYVLLTMIILCACSGKNESPVEPYRQGTFFIFESIYLGEGSGTLSFLDEQGNYYEEVYRNVNGNYLGDVLRDIWPDSGNIYILLQNNGLVVADAATMLRKKAVGIKQEEGFHPKRFMVAGDNAFISYTDAVYGAKNSGIRMMNLHTGDLSPDIDGTSGATAANGSSNMRMVCCNQKIYAPCGHRLSVIDPLNGKIIRQLDFEELIKGVVKGADGNIWVAFAGTPSCIRGIDTKVDTLLRTNELPAEISFASSNSQPHTGMCGSLSGAALFFWHRTAQGMKIFRHTYDRGITDEIISLNDYADLRGGTVSGYLGVHPRIGTLYVPVILDNKKVIVAAFDSHSGQRLQKSYAIDRDNCYGIDFTGQN